MDCGGQFFPWQRMKKGIYVKGTPSIHPPTPLCFGGRNNGNVDKRNLPKKFKPLEGGQFRFWSNLKVPFMYTCGINHFFRIFNPTFDEWKSTFGVQSSHKRDLKKRKKIVLHTPYSKARCPPPPKKNKKKRKSTQLAWIEYYRIRTCCNTDPKRLPIMVRIHCKS